MKAKPESNPSRFTGQEAQRTLDEVRKRYGIRQSEPEAHPRVNTSSSGPKEPAKQQPRPTVRLQPSIPKAPFVPIERMRSHPPLERRVVGHSSVRASGSRSDNHRFHYLIRIAECALTLHCEVNADDDAAARHQVEQLPNLMEWRELSGAELAEILKNERALQAG
jgi:hypothetical protein